MARAWLALGANMGDAKKNIEQGISLLSKNEQIKIIKQSKIIISKAWGNINQADFHNSVIEVETELAPFPLLKICQKIENNMGRIRKEKWGARIIDIDIIAYENLEINTKELTIPHPFAHERDFVIDLLKEIAPQTALWIKEKAKMSSSL